MVAHRNEFKFRLHPIFLGLQLALAGAAMAAGPAPTALPTGGQVVSGQATISQPGAAQLQINQATQQATLNWQTFNIGSAAQVNFQQPHASSVALNRVLQSDASVIEGKLTANGQVFLVNPGGVIFGKTAQVDVGGLVATTMNISDKDFANGKYHFTRDGSTAAVVNNGQITAANGGYVALIGATVVNSGTITANQGTVALAAGEGVTLQFNGSNLVNIQVDPATVKTLIENKQLIQAPDGQVLMTAVVASQLQGAVINNTGTVEANSITSSGGVIRLTGANEIDNSGTLDASGKTTGGTVQLAAASTINQSGTITAASSTGSGGNITLTATNGIDNTGTIGASGAAGGGNVTVDLTPAASQTTPQPDPVMAADPVLNAAPGPIVHQGGSIHADSLYGVGGQIVLTGEYLQLDNGSVTTATGATGGGAIYAGGGLHGAQISLGTGLSLQNASYIRVELGATLDASATNTGNGGTIVAWGDSASRAYGTFNATGGPNGGNGGTVETSGHWLDVTGVKVDTSAVQGQTGQWLLDPYNVTISTAATDGGGSSGGAWTPSGTGSNVNNTDIANGLASGNVTITTTGSGTENGDITVNAPVSWSSNTKLSLQADNNINVNASITATGTTNATGLTLSYGTAAGNGDFVNAPINLPSTAILNIGPGGSSGTAGSLHTYTIINSLGVANDSSTTTLQGMMNGLSGYYALGSNIDASTTASWNNNAGFNPVGTYGNSFTGNFHGLGHTISGLTIKRPATDYVGLFGYAESDTLRNIGLTGGAVTGRNNVGALVGYANSGSITNSYNTGTVSGYGSVGGLVGSNNYGTITNAYSTGAVSGGGSDTGGLVGSNNYGIINYAYSTGAVSGNGAVGGLVGDNGVGQITYAYSTGAVSGGSYLGGLVGSNYNGSVSNSYWDANTTGLANAVGYTVHSTTSNVANVGNAPYAQASYSAFDFNNAWWVSDGNTRPFLRSEYSTTISNAHQLQLMAVNPTANYTLANYIDMSELKTAEGLWNIATGFVPMGNFSGSFNGGGYVINGLTINLPTLDNVGLFGYSSGSISNVGLVGGSVSGQNYVGGLVGNNYGTISNAYNTGVVSGSTNVGGLTGYTQGSITNAYSTGAVSGVYEVGGLVGYNNLATLSSASSTGTVSGSSDFGGLVGKNTGTIIFSYSTSEVRGNGSWWVGGLVGTNAGSISNAYSTGAVSGIQNVGGLAGLNTGSISNAYSTGAVSGNQNVGGLVGLNNSGTFTKSFWDTQTSGIAAGTCTSPGSCGTGLTTADMMKKSSFTGWNFTTDWWMSDSYTRPFLRSEYSTTITNAHQLQLMAIDPTANYTLANNINMSELQSVAGLWSTATGFVPVGNSTTNFTGSFNGNGYTISGLVINQPATDYVGLFGYSSGSIHNVGLVGSSILGNTSVGGLVGDNKGSITNAYSTGTFSDSLGGSVGGLVGWNEYSGTITLSYSSGAVNGGGSGSYNGGLVGQNDGTITKAYSTATVSSPGNANNDLNGGLVGYNNGSISNVYSTGAVTYGGGKNGGLVGANGYQGTIGNAYSTGAVILGDGTNGGLVGVNAKVVTNSFWDQDTSGQSTSGGAEIGLPTNQMMTKTNFSSAGWDFTNTWGIIDGVSYPYLQFQFASTPQIVSGMLNGTDIGGKTLQTAQNGSLLTTVSTGVNGFYYLALPANTVPNGNTLLSYLTNPGNNPAATVRLSDGNSLTGVDLFPNTLTVGSNSTAAVSNANIASAKGSLTSTDIPYTASGNNIIVNAGVAFTTASNTSFNLNGNISTQNADITLNSNTHLVMTNTLAASGTGNVTLNITGGANEDVGSGITAAGLQLLGAGNYSLFKANYFNTLAINTSASWIGLGVGNDLTIGKVGTTTGINTHDQNLEIDLGGNLSIQESMDTGTAGVLLSAGGISQTSSGLMTTNLLLGNVTGTVQLDQANNIANLGGWYGFTTGGNLTLNDAKASGLTVTGIVQSSTGSVSISNTGGNLIVGATGTNTGSVSGNGVNLTATGSSSDVVINNGISWADNGALTLQAGGNIQVNANITATGTNPSLTLSYGTASGNGDFVNNGAAINLPSTANLQIGPTGSLVAYTIINSLGVAGDATTTTLQGMINGLTGHYALGSNIKASATAGWNSGAGFSPVGNSTNNFTGNFDGLGHTVGNLTINRPTTDYVGLFGVSNGSLRNVGLVGSDVTGNQSVGGLVGSNYYGNIINDYNSGNVSGNLQVGGLVGSKFYGTLSNAYSSGTVSSAGDSVGGLVGGNYGSISNVYSTSTVIGNGGFSVGGLVGVNYIGSIANAYSSGAVNGNNAHGVGGLVGNNSGTVSNAYSTGAVNGNSYFVGGLVGSNGGTITNAYSTGAVGGNAIDVGGLAGLNSGSISSAYSTGAVSGSSNVGGLVGINQGNVSNSYWDANTSGVANAIGSNQGTSSNVVNVGSAPYAQASYSSFDFNNTWWISDGNTRPFLLSEYSITISNGHQLQLMAVNPSASYTLVNNINMGELQSASGLWNTATGFVPVVNFTGRFNGGGFVISGLTINQPNIANVGLFGDASGTISNVGLVGGSVSGQYNVGGLAGINYGSISNVYNTGTITVIGTNLRAAGLVGLNYGSIANAYSSSTVNGNGDIYSSVGGLVGYNIGSITNAYSTGTVSSNAHVGGLVGLNSGSITNAYNTGTISGEGGLVGWNDYGGSITNAYNTGTVSGTGTVGGLVGVNQGSIANAYSTGIVNGNGAVRVGGLVGLNYGSITNAYSTGLVNGIGASQLGGLVGFSSGGTVTGSFWDTTTSTIAASSCTSPGTCGVGMATADMMNLANFTSATPANGNVNPNWDFAGTWWMSDGNTRPFLRFEYSTNITNAHQLQLMAVNPSANYTLANNINMGELQSASGLWNTATGFVPVGNLTINFTGSFNGNGYTISGLTINRPTTDYIGMFGDSSGAISNVGLVGGSVTGNANVGGLLGANNYGSITNAYGTGLVSGNQKVGGLVGANAGSITNSYSAGTVNGNNAYWVGGLVGYNGGNLTSVYSTGTVNGSGATNLGGLVGANDVNTSVSNAYSTAAVNGSGAWWVGGLVGANGGSITNAYSNGAVSGNTYVGGLVGSNGGSLTNTYSTGAVSGVQLVGGLLGSNSGNITGSFWDNQASGQTSSAGGTGMSTADMMKLANFTSATIANGNVNPHWDFTNTWVMADGHTYPYLQALTQLVSGTLIGGVAGDVIQMAQNGNLLSTVNTQVGGFYDIVLPANTIPSGNILFFLTDSAGTPAATVRLSDGNSLTGVDLFFNTLTVGSNSAAAVSNSNLVAAKGGLFSTDIPYIAIGNNITLNTGVAFTTASNTNYLLNGDITTQNADLTLQSTSPIALGNNLSAGSGTIKLDATGALTQTAGTLTASIVNIGSAGTTTAIGSSGAAIATVAANLNAQSSNGDIWLSNTGATNLTASASGGAVNVVNIGGNLTVPTTGSVTGKGVSLTASGASSAITLNGAVNGGVGIVTLNATAGATQNAVGIITADTLVLQGVSADYALGTATNLVNHLSAPNIGSVNFKNGSSLIVDQTGGITANDAGGVTLFTTGTGSNLFVRQNILATQANAPVTLQSDSDIVIGQSGVTSGPQLTSAGGNILLASDVDGNQIGGISLFGASLASNGSNITLGGGDASGTGPAGGLSTVNNSIAGGNLGNIGISLGASSLDARSNTGGGNIILTGTGKQRDGTAYADGIQLVALADHGVNLKTSGSGYIFIYGTGDTSSTGSNNNGIELNASLGGTITISTVNNGISLYGNGGGSGNASNSNTGILLATAGIGSINIGSSGTGSLSLTGKAGNESNSNNITSFGIIADANSALNTNTGGISLEAYHSLAGTNSIISLPGTVKSTGGGNITLTADTLNFPVPKSPSISSSGVLLLQPEAPSAPIVVGGSGGTLNLAASLFNGTNQVFKTGFNYIQIGNASGTGGFTVNASTTVNDNLRLVQGSGAISINASLTLGSVGASKNLLLQTTGSGTEDTTNGGIIASGLQLLGSGGSYVLGSSNNRIETLAGNTGSVDFTNDQGYAVTTVTNGRVNPTSTTGIITTAGDIVLHKGATSTNGYIAINAELYSGGGNIVLDASGVGGETKNGSTQGSGSTSAIVANGLILLGSGSHTLTNTGNQVSLLAGAGSAGDVTGTGTVIFTDSHTLSIGSLSNGGVSTNGLNSSGDVTLTIAGSLIQSQLLEVDGTLSGSATSVNLNNSFNTIANLGAFSTQGTGAYFTLVDNVSTGLTVAGAVTTNNKGTASITNTGALTVGGTGFVSGINVSLTTKTSGDITLNGAVTADTTAGTVTLDSAGNISQNSSGTITALTLTGSTGSTGTTSAQLYLANNQIANLDAFTTHGGFLLNDTTGLNVSGAVNSGTGSVGLSANGVITEGALASITTGTGANTGLLLYGSAFDLYSNNPTNSVPLFSALSKGVGDIKFIDSRSLVVGSFSVTAGTETWSVSPSGVTTSGPGAVILKTTTGDINGDGKGVTSASITANGSVTLDAAGGIGIGTGGIAAPVYTNTTAGTGSTGTPLNLITNGIGTLGNIGLVEDHTLNTSRINLGINGTSAAGNRILVTLGTLAGNTFIVDGPIGTASVDLTLKAPNSNIVNPSGSGPFTVTANTLTLQAGGAIGGTDAGGGTVTGIAPINTAAAAINATSSDAALGGTASLGGIYLLNNQTTTLTALATTFGASSGAIKVGNTTGMLTIGSGGVASQFNTVNLYDSSTATTDGITLATGSTVTGYNATAGGTAVTLSADQLFVNNSGSGAVSVNAGAQWLVYSADPTKDTFGVNSILSSGNTAQWHVSYADIPSTSLPAGNRYLFAYQPTITFTATDLQKTYGTDNTATVASDWTASGYYSGNGTGNAFVKDSSTSYSGTPNVTSLGSGATANVIASPGYVIFVDASPVTSANGNAINFQNAHLLVNALPVTLAPASVTKQYDTTTSYTTTPADLTALSVPLVGGDKVTAATIAYTNPNVGIGNKTVNASNLAISDGNGGNNYSVTLDPNTASTITKAPLAINAVTDTKVYDGTAVSLLTPQVVGLQSSPGHVDSVTLNGQSFASKNVLGLNNSLLQVNSGYAVNDGNSGLNYSLTVNTAPGTITALPVILAPASVTKQYDATTNYTATPADLAALSQPLVGGDKVTAATIAYTNPNYGIGNKAVNASNVVISDGNNGNNYSVALGPNTASTITKAPLAINAVTDTKVYDGTAASPLTPQVVGLQSSPGHVDSVTLNGQSFASKNVLGLNGSILNVNSGYVLNDGNGGNNYSVTLSGAVGQINPASLNLAAVTDTKNYNGTTQSTGVVTVTGLAASDSLSNLSQHFDLPDIGIRTLLVDPNYILNDGNGGYNYMVLLDTAPGAIVGVQGNSNNAGNIAGAVEPKYGARYNNNTAGSTPFNDDQYQLSGRMSPIVIVGEVVSGGDVRSGGHHNINENAPAGGCILVGNTISC